MDIYASITGIKYSQILIKELREYSINELKQALENDTSFLLHFGDKKTLAVSWWVSAKRTRSYPYARVYNTLNYQGKKVTIIPIYKDEGADGDRDYLQWDSISLMSLLGIYTIISYYSNAFPNKKYKNKITDQRFNLKHIKSELDNLLSYKSDALHWNLKQIDKIGNIANKALKSYKKISNSFDIDMHSFDSVDKRIIELLKGRDNFMSLSRELARNAQHRESVTIQPKEYLKGNKATITISNYLGGYYYLTIDELEIINDHLNLIESKHTKTDRLPSPDDIKDGLVKMILFSNIENVMINSQSYSYTPILKLTSGKKINLRKSEIELLEKLKIESSKNNFKIFINDVDVINL